MSTFGASDTINAAGAATVKLGPQGGWQAWRVSRISVSINSSEDGAECRVYAGEPNDASLLLGTYTGALDTASGEPITLQPGEFMTIVWAGGTPGNLASVALTYTAVNLS